jgi:glycosyltransferase involved in cell wall biosynthesis
MNICLICGEYPPAAHGGIGTVTESLARELVREGHRVRVIGIRERGDTAPEQEIASGVEVLRLAGPTVRRLGWLQGRYLLYKQVAAWARRGEVDLVEAPDYEGWTAGWRRLPVPLVVRLHGSVSYFSFESRMALNELTFQVERMALRRADFHCSTSGYTAELTRRLFRLGRFAPKILYNPVEVPSRNDHWRPMGNRVVYTGTLVAKKGVIPLIRAWSEVVRAVPDAELHLYGRDGRSPSGGSMREHLLAQVPESLRGSLVFHGHVPHPDILEGLRSARVGVFPSFSEAFGVAPLESMAQGCPTICSSRTSGPELLSDGVHGLLVDPANEGDIARAILQVLRDPALACRLATAGYRRVKETFAVEAVTRRNIAFYRSCVGQYGARS